jgi:hypothetical protein
VIKYVYLEKGAIFLCGFSEAYRTRSPAVSIRDTGAENAASGSRKAALDAPREA